jgi:hypothetical protein
MTLLHGHGRLHLRGSMRYTAMAPGRYVICDGRPDDPSDITAWQRQTVLADGSGRPPRPSRPGNVSEGASS